MSNLFEDYQIPKVDRALGILRESNKKYEQQLKRSKTIIHRILKALAPAWYKNKYKIFEIGDVVTVDRTLSHAPRLYCVIVLFENGLYTLRPIGAHATERINCYGQQLTLTKEHTNEI